MTYWSRLMVMATDSCSAFRTPAVVFFHRSTTLWDAVDVTFAYCEGLQWYVFQRLTTTVEALLNKPPASWLLAWNYITKLKLKLARVKVMDVRRRQRIERHPFHWQVDYQLVADDYGHQFLGLWPPILELHSGHLPSSIAPPHCVM